MSESNVVVLPGSGYVDPAEDRDAMIEMLEAALEDVKAGRLVSVALCGMSFDRGVRTCFRSCGETFALLGAVAMLLYRIQSAQSGDCAHEH